jgi:magnesium transporter
VVDNYVPVIEALESEVAELEDRVLKDRITRGDVERIYQLRRELLQLRRTVAPTIEVCRRLEHLELPLIDAAIRAYFRDVVDHVQRVNESIDALREVLAFSFEAALLLQSARQSDIQRRFAGWAAILAVPTAIAGIYGMNFDFMPELNVRFGYFTVLTVILAICLYLFYRFRKAGWVLPCGIGMQRGVASLCIGDALGCADQGAGTRRRLAGRRCRSSSSS